MTKIVNQMIKNSTPYKLGEPLRGIYIISTGKLYQGFCGKNGYNGIILIGIDAKGNQFYNINGEYEVDVVRFCNGVEIGGVDIPHDENCVHVWFKRPVCFTDVLSTMEVMPYRKTEEK